MPALAGLGSLITWIVGAITLFFGFIKEFIVKYFIRKVEALPFFTTTVLINTAILGLFLSYLYAIFSLIRFVYDKITYFINFLNSGFGGSQVSNLLNNMLISMRFYDALSDVFTIFSPVLNSMILILAYRYGYKALQGIRNNVLSLVVSKLT